MMILITGGAGYVGSHVALNLIRRGAKVVILDDLSTGNIKLVPRDAQFQHACITQPGLVYEICERYKIDTLIHMAAVTSVPESIRDPLGYLHTNFNMTQQLIGNAISGGVRKFVFSSTAAVYGSSYINSGPSKIVPEAAPTAPENMYGRSKLMCEWLLEALGKDTPDLKYTILRYFNVAGADAQMQSGQISGDGLFRTAIRLAMDGQSVPVYGNQYGTRDGTAVRDYTHVTDIAAAHADAMFLMSNSPHFKGVTLNLGYGEGYTVLEVIRAIERAMGKLINVVHCPPRPGDVGVMVADSSRAKSILGWRPKFALLETMARSAVEWEYNWKGN